MRQVWRVALLAALAGAACANDDVSSVIVSGSSTVAPISALVAEDFQTTRPETSVTVDGPGTGDGFQLFCDGEVDVTGASRPIKDEEAADCRAAGVDFVELAVAYDGIAVLTSPANTAVDCLSFADLYALAGPESKGVTRWSRAEPLARELGSTTTLPDLELVMIAPGEESGTYDSFIELAFHGVAEARVEAGAISDDQVAQTRPDYQASSDDNVILQGIEGARGAFGWVGFAFAHEAGDAVKLIEIDAGDGCVAPTPATIADGSYPISRPLFVYVNKAAASTNPVVADYIDFYLGDGMAVVEEVGYVRLPADQLARSRAVWEAR
ncbi:MAG TPA: phosphate ABC transporter substrate-binding protein PstS family protein [Acidimicrobiales bacterium]|nr:phosphate ABC transporter substrate-binding protein PstS family protein [Acidimicrobiales bacterium]